MLLSRAFQAVGLLALLGCSTIPAAAPVDDSCYIDTKLTPKEVAEIEKINKTATILGQPLPPMVEVVQLISLCEQQIPTLPGLDTRNMTTKEKIAAIVRVCIEMPGMTCTFARGRPIVAPCPSGFYCQDFSEKAVCPRGFFCPLGSQVAQECRILPRWTCDHMGQRHPKYGLPGFLIFCMLVPSVLVIFALVSKKQDREAWPSDSALWNSYYTTTLEPSGRFRSGRVRAASERMDSFESDPELRVRRSITFSGLSLSVKGKKILQDLDGVIEARTTCALMGPAGAGKTCLLTVLRGRAWYGRTSGRTMVNGHEVESLLEYNDIMGYVPQEDILYTELTVKENIWFSAALFSRTNPFKDLNRRRSRVRDVICALELGSIRDSRIGDAESRGISGGQRKRVNVAMELVKRPTILFMDEPTSGLDSATSAHLMSILGELAGRYITIVATIHQPRREVFEGMDNLILLAPGGRMVYCGPTKRLTEYFNQVGYQCPDTMNPSDFMMDVLAGAVPMGMRITARQSQAYMIEQWPLYKHAYLPPAEENIVAPPASRRMGMPVHFFVHLYFVSRRQLKLFVAGMWTTVVDLALCYCIGLLLALIFGQIEPGGREGNLLQQFATLQLGYAMLANSVALRTLGLDHVMYLREEEAGMWILPYYLAKLLSTLPMLLLQPVAFSMSYVPIATPAQGLHMFYITLLVLATVTHAFANLITMLAPKGTAVIVSSTVTLLLWVFSGVVVLPDKIVHNIPVVGPAVYVISYFRLSTRALILSEIDNMQVATRSIFGAILERKLFPPSLGSFCSTESCRFFLYPDHAYVLLWLLIYAFILHAMTVAAFYFQYEGYHAPRTLYRKTKAWMRALALRCRRSKPAVNDAAVELKDSGLHGEHKQSANA